jgi:hypothetical protein
MLILLIILKILLYLLLFIIGLALLLLLLPINYSGQVIAADGFRAEVAVGWAWKLLGISAEMEGEAVDISLRLFNKRIFRIKNRKTAVKEEKTDNPPEEKKKESKPDKGLGFKDITDKALLEEILGYFKRVLNIVKPKYLHIYGTYGFEDPSITGAICGGTGILKSMLPHARLNLMPDFTREVMDIDMRVEGNMVVGSLAYQTIRTVLKKPVRKILFRKKKS